MLELPIKMFSRLIPPLFRTKKQEQIDKAKPKKDNIVSSPKIESKQEIVVVEAQNPDFVTNVQLEEPEISDVEPETIHEIKGIKTGMHTENAPFAESEIDAEDVEMENRDYVIPEKFFEIPQEVIQSSYSRKFSQDIPSEYAFVLNDGRKLKNLNELVLALQDMSENIFSHHVNENKNDFANWIRDVIKEQELANAVIEKRTKKELLTALRGFQ